uniref:Uncharacterized protein LOC100376916 n=1 Tax=Saccoglossus kowalevskii TaxID=10224 RepID=A0ABM0GLH4_SACKO|nr:PREDICTED: uncharacterized protein LOC100376916 [Saccoglossus kowalevskii]
MDNIEVAVLLSRKKTENEDKKQQHSQPLPMPPPIDHEDPGDDSERDESPSPSSNLPLVNHLSCSTSTRIPLFKRGVDRVSCSECGERMLKKNLKRHEENIHGNSFKSLPVLKSYSVNRENSLFAVEAGPRNALPIHAEKELLCTNPKVFCESSTCIQAATIATRSRLPSFECQHLLSVNRAIRFIEQPFLLPVKLDELCNTYHPFSESSRDAALTLNSRSIANGSVPLYPLFESASTDRQLRFSIHTGETHYYSILGRVIVSYDSDKKTWHCRCCKKRGCGHKALARWYCYQVFPGKIHHGASEDQYETDDIDDGNTLIIPGAIKQLHSYPPVIDISERMVEYWLRHKKIPPDISLSMSENFNHTRLMPVEKRCKVCKSQPLLDSPLLISSNANIVAMNGLIKVSSLKLPDVCEDSDKVDVETFWKKIEMEKLVKPLIRYGEKNPFQVTPSYSAWAPYIGRATRGETVWNTEHRKVIRETERLETDCRDMSEERLIELLNSSSITVAKVKEICSTCNIAATGSKYDMVLRIRQALIKNDNIMNKVFQKIWGASGGWLSASCPHRIVYAVKFLIRAESPRDHVDLIRSFKVQPSVVIVDMPHMVARHGNIRYPQMFHPYDGRVAESTSENIMLATEGKLEVHLPWLYGRQQSSQGNHVLGDDVHLCLYDVFHQQNTSKEEEVLRRISNIPELHGIVNSQVAEQIHNSRKRDIHFLNTMGATTHIFILMNVIHSHNMKVNADTMAKMTDVFKAQVTFDSLGRAVISHSTSNHSAIDHISNVTEHVDSLSEQGDVTGQSTSNYSSIDHISNVTVHVESLSEQGDVTDNIPEHSVIDLEVAKEILGSIAMDQTQGYNNQVIDIMRVLRESRETAEKETENITRLRDALLREGLEECLPPTPMDGNCLFHALCEHICRVKDIPRTELSHYELRELILNFMSESKTELQKLTRIQ